MRWGPFLMLLVACGEPAGGSVAVSCDITDPTDWVDLGEVPITSVFNVRTCVGGLCEDGSQNWRFDESRHLVQANCENPLVRHIGNGPVTYTLDWVDAETSKR